MGQLNDTVLTAIALQYGDNQAMESPDLVPAILPMVDSDRYRRRVTIFLESAAVTAVQSQVKMTFEFPSDPVNSKRVFLAEIVNGDTGGKVLVTGQVRATDLTSHFIEPLNCTVNEGASEPVIGLMEMNRDDDFRPASIWVPRAANLIITIKSQGATFSMAANMQLRMMVEDEPPEDQLRGGVPTETVIA